MKQFKKLASNKELLNELKKFRDQKWDSVRKNAGWANFILDGKYSKTFYGIYLIETYHYVKENPKHQALVAIKGNNLPPNYSKFCYEHAEEETGHELMALHDLGSLNFQTEEVISMKPLSETEQLISYLYYISENGNPLRRLGYSFWAEDSYQYIQDLLASISTNLDLSKENMTFLVSHSSIDEKHSAEVEEVITKFCKSSEDFEDILEVMNTTIDLQSNMLSAIVREYDACINKKSEKYGSFYSI